MTEQETEALAEKVAERTFKRIESEVVFWAVVFGAWGLLDDWLGRMWGTIVFVTVVVAVYIWFDARQTKGKLVAAKIMQAFADRKAREAS